MTPEQRGQTLIAIADTPTRIERKGGPDAWSRPRDRWTSRVETFEALIASGAPERELKAAWSFDLEPCNALSSGVGWAKAQSCGLLVLSGAVGRGKTVAAARYALSTGAAWCHAPLLALDEWSQAAKRVEAFLRSRHLVLDEVGGPGTTNGGAVSRISALLTARHASARPTVVTTNLTEEEFARIYDGAATKAQSRLIDRINDGGAWVTCVRVRGDHGRVHEVDSSFRESGGCSYENNRYREAKRCLDLLHAVESGDVRQLPLDELQDALGIDDAKMLDTFEQAASQRERMNSAIDRLVEESSFAHRFDEGPN